jgi:hypothetical protein
MATKSAKSARLSVGQRLYCVKCGSEIEVINPSTCDPPHQVFRCCDQDMKLSVGRDVHVGVE